jgi:hypothetical protein
LIMVFGALAEWLGRSLQSFVRGFDSLTRLQQFRLTKWGKPLKYFQATYAKLVN